LRPAPRKAAVRVPSADDTGEMAKTRILATFRNATVRGLRRKPNVIVGLCALVAVLAGVLVADTQTSAIRDVREPREQIDRVRLTGPDAPPELVPPRAPGPGATA